MRFYLTTMLLLCATNSVAEELAYQIYIFERGVQKTLFEGVRSYTRDDIKTDTKFALSSTGYWEKELKVTDKFIIGASIYREKELTGFGLWIQMIPEWYEFWSDGGFSWEWFNKDAGNTFAKLQEYGKVKVKMNESGEYQEIKSIEFLSDVTMRLNNSWNRFSRKNTHYMVVKKGSVLNFTP